ncbi:hypothetical protein K4F52_001702 [Lecanicillium sp. MT-2017a]|nr:hypothetical protein K4F52_001702 [Lecanicillium sp. MT-2017a]
MHFTKSSLALAASFTSLASARLDKPVINPPFPGGGLDSLSQGLLDNLKPTHSTSDDWTPGWIPKDCKAIAEGSGFSANDITPFNIHYDDCGDAWVFCRHKDSPLSKIDMIDIFGRLPVRMRQFIRHIVALPGTKSAGSSGDNIQMNGPIGITVYVHEIGHSLDSHAFDAKYGAPFSNSKVWIDNYNMDSAVTDSYAQSSQQENFAQETVVSLFDKVVPGGVGTIQPNWRAIFHQYATLQGYIGDIIIPGGQCTHRLTNSPAVPKSNSARLFMDEAAKPDVALSDNVTEIEAIPMGDTIELTEFDEAGQPSGSKVVNLYN